MFLRNTWYVACTSEEIRAKPLGRKIGDENIVFYRDGEGRIVALEDFCPHRGAPLSLGIIEDGYLVCGYHGLKLGADGKPHSMPRQQVRNFPCVRSFPVVEKYAFVWVWLGEAELADSSCIPELPWLDSSDWAFGGGLYHIHCDYRLMIDNLMDLTHETYVHSGSIGQREIDEASAETVVEGNSVITRRFMNHVNAPPFWQMALRENDLAADVPVDRWQICRFTPPSHVMIEVGVAHAGLGGYEANDQHKVSSVVVDFITPETEGSMWYFWGMARSFKPESSELTDKIREGQGKIFSEDLQMLERQQRNLEKNPERRLMNLDIDAGGFHSRRIIDKLIAQEQVSVSTDC